MHTITFGTQGHKAPQVVLGLMRIRSLTTEAVTRLVETAVDEGISMLDTAPVYEPSEELLGSVFAARPQLRDRVILQTKVGITKNPASGNSYYDFSKRHILESVDKSLRNLKTDHIDSLLLHRPDALMDPNEVADTFRELKGVGKVLDFGVSNQNPAMMQMLADAFNQPLATNQIQLSVAFAPAIDAMFHVNRMDNEAVMRDGGILEHCRRTNVVVQAWSPLQYGNMDGCFVGSSRFPNLNEKLKSLASDYGVKPSAIALAWVLRYPATMQAVVGTTRPDRVRELARACDVKLTRAEWYDLYQAAYHDIP